MKIRTLQLMGGGKPGGAEVFFVRLMTAFAARPDEIEVLPVVRKGGWAAERLSEAGVRYATATFGGMFDLSSKVTCRRLAAEFQPNLCMSWMNRATRFMPQPPRRTTPQTGGWARVARLGGFYDLKNYRGCVSELVGNTQQIVDYCVTSGWDPARATMIGNFTPIPAPVADRAADRARLREALGIAASATVLLVASRLHAVKGYDIALQALQQLPEDAVLVGIGDGPERTALASLTAQLGLNHRVRWAGWVDALQTYANAADIWLLPSRHEPLGNSVLDAWAHGLPIVASRAGGPMSLIEDGLNGLLVPIDDASALAAAVKRLMDDPMLRDTLTTAGRSTLAREHGEAVVVQQYFDYYRRLIEQR